ncbi:MAG: response regulator [Spirochaetota bacterium]|nr:MAG: response regulator [Spirochaetota bacterium]
MDISRRVLIVEPDNKYALELVALLVNEGYDLEISRSFTDAVQMVNDVNFDCVIMDVDLPDIRGYEAVPIMKAIDPKIQIIMTAHKNTKELEAKVRSQDVYYYYIKSFDRHELKLAVYGIYKKLGKIKEVRKEDGSPYTTGTD